MEPALKRPPKMTSEEFLRWYEEQPEGHRYELHEGVPIRIMAEVEVLYDGERVRMQAERNVHAIAKFIVARQFADQIDRQRLPCRAYGDGMAVRIDEDRTYEPDAMVRCGPELPPDALVVTDPLNVVEVSSGHRNKVDASDKLLGYFGNPHIAHYVLVSTKRRHAIHHRRAEGQAVLMMPYLAGSIRLDPPGLTLDLDALFAALPKDEEA